MNPGGYLDPSQWPSWMQGAAMPAPPPAPYQAGDLRAGMPPVQPTGLLDTLKSMFSNEPWTAGGVLNAAMTALPGMRTRGNVSLIRSKEPIGAFAEDKVNHNYRIIRNGAEDIGGISLDVGDPKSLMVNTIENYKGGGPNSIGPSAVAGVKQEIERLYPDVMKLYGRRVSGARAKAGLPRYAEYNYPDK
jgi:hypothetical protein